MFFIKNNGETNGYVYIGTTIMEGSWKMGEMSINWTDYLNWANSLTERSFVRHNFLMIWFNIIIIIPLTQNITQVENENLDKYQDLSIEIKRMWKLSNIDVVPLVISVEGVISKRFKDSLKNCRYQLASTYQCKELQFWKPVV